MNTTKQDHINAILKSLAEIALAEPFPYKMAEIARLVAEFNPGTEKVSSVDGAIEILTAFNDL